MDDTWHGFNIFRRRLFDGLREYLALMEFTRNNPELVELGQVLLQKRGCRR